MDHKPRILVVGSFVMDVIDTTERVPASAQTVYGKSFHMAPGGKGANQALQCARLGAQVTMMGCVGDDLFGQALLNTPRQSGVDVSRVLVEEDLHAIARALWEKGVENVIITLGGQGSAVVSENSIDYIPCVRMPHVADPTAAGDSFVGALAVGLTVGLSRQAALTFASHTAAITVSRMGAMPSLPTLAEVKALLTERGCDVFPLSCLDILQ